MNITKRFIVQIFIQIFFTFFLSVLIFVIFFAIIGFSLAEVEINNDLANAESNYFSDKISIKNATVTFDKKLQDLVKKQNGSLVLVNENGKIIGNFHASDSLPGQLSNAQLATFLDHNASSLVNYTYWELEDSNNRPILLLYGKNNIKEQLMQKIKEEVRWTNRELPLSPETLAKLRKHDAWVQLINGDGEEIAAAGTEKQPSRYTIDKLQTLFSEENDSTTAYFDNETNQTLLVGTNSPSVSQIIDKIVANRLIFLYGALFLLFLFSIFWYARKFALPLIVIMKWIESLGKGNYELPLDQQNRLVMWKANGKVKRNFRLYKDIINTLSHLTETLRKNDAAQWQMNQTREEWISGLSHDLKTPLSSILGYAHMLNSETYTWSKAETREFGNVIVEKSNYMMQLIEDLTLTYRLKSKNFPFATEKIDVNEFVRRSVIHFINDETNNDKQFLFQPCKETIYALLDPKWFQRIIDNVIANAMNHNPPGTTIDISIHTIEQFLFVITIKDNGRGMDKETQHKLFQRYYRGTNTKSGSDGSGLGMAITKQLVHLQKGTINVESKENEGTTVRILFPMETGENLNLTAANIVR
ncbi:HAMP domain-containing histidine kinase [Bacillaceae bacterium Marseille-Q3522]|nr:HAMP domain-containing histidine kinase [Bacillaceae bacterium Marseille-Q3522]